MQTREAQKNERKQWDDFVKEHGPRSGRFLHSWDWGVFQHAVGEDVHRMVVEDEEWQAVAAVTKRTVPLFGTYAYIPKGPIAKTDRAQSALFQDPLLQQTMFIRCEPSKTIKAKKTVDVQPAHTLITDLSKTEGELQAAMHRKTRYNIGLAQRKDVRMSVGVDSLDAVWPLFEATSSHGRFRLHPKSYYASMLRVGFLATAKYEDQIVAANIMIDFDGTRTYLHGSSSPDHRELMAPYALHWDLMVDAKEKGLHAYDWWGVAPPAAKRHPWAGISRFKRGFGGEEVSSPGTFDIINKRSLYAAYHAARTAHRHLKKK